MIIESIIHFLHIGAAITWIGGMAFFFTTLIPALRSNLQPVERVRIMSAAGRRFKWISFASIGILIVTGVAKVHEIAINDSPSSIFWNVLWVKIFLVVVVVILSYVHDMVWGPRLITPRPGEDIEKVRYRVRLLARVHFAILIVIVMFGVILLHLHN